ncbi:MAG: DUF5131 family protein [Actinobacteria bacterium]|nr:DUF5131 family protein [Actinomycetota bacterium]
MSASKIEWTEATWNPTTGCDRISPGCNRCYAMTMARRLKAMGSEKYQNDGDPRTSGPGFAVTMHQESVLDPIVKWPRKSQMVFLDSMSDVFHARVAADFQGQIFATMALTPQHSYQVLTKRPGRMRELLADGDQCQGNGIAFLHKQNGEWATTRRYGVGILDGPRIYGSATQDAPHGLVLHEILQRVGKKAAGRELDGRTWDEFPIPVGRDKRVRSSYSSAQQED